MFESEVRGVPTSALLELKTSLTRFDPTADASARIDRIRALEELKGAIAAAQAREIAAFVSGQRAEQIAAGIPAERVGRGITAQIALARRVSPFHAQRHAGWATILTTELPATFAELAAGRISEWRAMIIARETAWLSREHRAVVDAELAPTLNELGDRRVEAAARTLAYRLDPHGYVNRVRGATTDRNVTVRPAPDVMSRLSALLPAAQGIAAHTAIAREADRLRAAGDPRSRGQLMADLLVQRLTGQAAADAVPVEVNLLMPADTLLGAGLDADEPAQLVGYGPIPADIARDLVNGPGGVTAHDDGGPTSVANGQGLCEACNHAKQAPGWNATADRDTITITTPTGHRYLSQAPDPPGRKRSRSPVETLVSDLLWAA